MKEKLMPREILRIMEKHINAANALRFKNLESINVKNSNIFDIMSDEQKSYLDRSKDVAYLDVCLFNKSLYFIIMDEFLFIKCQNCEYTIDGIMAETLYNDFRDLVLNKGGK